MVHFLAGLLLFLPAIPIASAQDSSVAAPAAEAAPSTVRDTIFAPGGSLARRLALLAAHNDGIELPAAESVTVGDRRIEASEKVAGSVAVASGDLDIFGEVAGDALALDGDVIIHRGGVLRGDALAVSGRVRLDGGIVEGEMRSLSELPSGPAGTAVPALSSAEQTRRALGIAAGWLVMLAMLGVGVLIFAGAYLDGVTDTMTERFARSFWAGVLGQLALIPALLLLVVGLALTILGILLIPFAIVAYVLAVAGLLAIGFLAVARLTGAAIVRPGTTGPASERGASLRSLLLGVLILLVPWLVAAALTWSPMAALALRTFAVVITWVAATVGFGATILSRAGTRPPISPREPAQFADEVSWQTPTPVAGIVAARRPTPAPGRTGTV